MATECAEACEALSKAFRAADALDGDEMFRQFAKIQAFMECLSPDAVGSPLAAVRAAKKQPTLPKEEGTVAAEVPKDAAAKEEGVSAPEAPEEVIRRLILQSEVEAKKYQASLEDKSAVESPEEVIRRLILQCELEAKKHQAPREDKTVVEAPEEVIRRLILQCEVEAKKHQASTEGVKTEVEDA